MIFNIVRGLWRLVPARIRHGLSNGGSNRIKEAERRFPVLPKTQAHKNFKKSQGIARSRYARNISSGDSDGLFGVVHELHEYSVLKRGRIFF